MATQRFDKIAYEKRAQILEAAGRQFADHGYDGESLDHILQHADLSKGAAYYYFENKADLFATVVEHYVNIVLEESDEMLSMIEGLRDWDRIAQHLTSRDSKEEEHHNIFHSLRTAWELSREAHEDDTLNTLFKRVDDWFAKHLKRGQELGLIRKDIPRDLLADIYNGIQNSIGVWWAENSSRLDAEKVDQLHQTFVGLFIQLLAPPPQQPVGGGNS